MFVRNLLFILFLAGLTSTVFAQPQYFQGGIIRGDTSKKEIALVFTGHEYADGAKTIIKTLKQTKTPASFFFTGHFYRNQPKVVRKLKKNYHYLGPHSDQHLLYNSWDNRDSLLVTKQEFVIDLLDNYALIDAPASASKYFIPPYEWYNQTIADWSKELGFQLFNFTPGTRSNADYTTPEMSNYLSSEEILKTIYQYEEAEGINGFILLIHIGTAAERTDKLYDHLKDLINYLTNKGYVFKRIDTLLD